jgi:hypothetical protein
MRACAQVSRGLTKPVLEVAYHHIWRDGPGLSGRYLVVVESLAPWARISLSLAAL